MQTKVTLFTGRPYEIPDRVGAFLDWLTGLVPPEHRDDAEIDIEATSEYGDSVTDIEVYYWRDATAEEEAAARKADADRVERERLWLTQRLETLNKR